MLAKTALKTFYDFINIDYLARSTFFTRRHKGTKRDRLKMLKLFFVISVIFV